MSNISYMLIALLFCASPDMLWAHELDDVHSDVDEQIFELETYQQSGPKLDLYGFIDFSYLAVLGSDYELINDFGEYSNLYSDGSHFAVGNLNVYLSSQLGERWKSLAEIRFLYLPNGNPTYDTSSTYWGRQSTFVTDYAEWGRSIAWGGISIQRAWIEFNYHDLLNIKAGHWLTPVGIWNIDHSSATIIPIRMPYVLVEGLFPKSQTGLQFSGTVNTSIAMLGYHLTVSNGRGDIHTYFDMDKNKGLGARLYANFTQLGSATIGFSAYYGEYTDKKYQLNNIVGVEERFFGTDAITTEQYYEFDTAVDVIWKIKKWHFQAEFIFSQILYTDEGRPALEAFTGFAPDKILQGGYFLAAYSIDSINLSPFIFFEVFIPGVSVPTKGISMQYIGLNYRPIPAVSIKGQFDVGLFYQDGLSAGVTDTLYGLEFQIAWAF